jgi:hypothetical protein
VLDSGSAAADAIWLPLLPGCPPESAAIIAASGGLRGR